MFVLWWCKSARQTNIPQDQLFYSRKRVFSVCGHKVGELLVPCVGSYCLIICFSLDEEEATDCLSGFMHNFYSQSNNIENFMCCKARSNNCV